MATRRKDVEDSVTWFKNLIKGRNNPNATYHAVPQIGSMYMYRYDPKWKEVLPFWDKQPLTIPIDYYSDGFLGLNLHYLPPSGRSKLLSALSKYTTGENEKKTMQVSYSILQTAIRHRLFMPCVKRYLTAHVRSRFEYIQPDEWSKAVSLPTQRFQGARAMTVWRRSARR